MDSFDIYFKIKSVLYNSSNIIQERNNIDDIKKRNYIPNINETQKTLTNKNKLIKLNYVTFFLLVALLPIVNGQEQILSKFSYITFKIKKNGKIILFNPLDKNDCKKLTLPNIIQIEGINYTDIKFNYPINNTQNKEKEIKLIWGNNNQPSSTNCLFQECTDITQIDLSNFNTSEVTSMYRMFYNCKSLTSLNLSKLEDMNQIDISRILSESSYLSSFDTSKVTRMVSLFYGCSSLKNLNISNFATSKVKSMEHMFYSCSSMISLDISNFDTSQVINMKYMFYNCQKLEKLNLSKFNTSQVVSMAHMFDYCS